MAWLYIPVIALVVGAGILIFARDWVWSIDQHSEAFERDETGQPIRTAQWDKLHLMQGIIMLIVAIILAIIVTLVT